MREEGDQALELDILEAYMDLLLWPLQGSPLGLLTRLLPSFA